MDGLINIYKPKGSTCTAILGKIRSQLQLNRTNKIGHIGTLDPLADGVLPVALGQATRLIPFIIDDVKSYRFTIKFGSRTSTADLEGAVIDTTTVYPNEVQARAVCSKFIGEIEQTPPKFSALKVAGRRAYELARANASFTLPSRIVTIHSLACIGYNAMEQQASYEVQCAKGTYIRSLAEDIAHSLQSLGFVLSLTRTAVGKALLADSVSVEQLATVHVQPMTAALTAFLSLEVDEQAMLNIKQGRKYPVSTSQEGIISINYRQQLLAIGMVRQGIFNPHRVFNIIDKI